MADSGEEIKNFANNSAYYQTYGVQVLFSKITIIIYMSIF